MVSAFCGLALMRLYKLQVSGVSSLYVLKQVTTCQTEHIVTLRTRETGLTSACLYGLLKLPNSAHPPSEHFFLRIALIIASTQPPCQSCNV